MAVRVARTVELTQRLTLRPVPRLTRGVTVSSGADSRRTGIGNVTQPARPTTNNQTRDGSRPDNGADRDTSEHAPPHVPYSRLGLSCAELFALHGRRVREAYGLSSVSDLLLAREAGRRGRNASDGQASWALPEGDGLTRQ